MAKILIVDDNALNREVLRLVLEGGDHLIEEAEDGDIALAFDLSAFDLVLTDIFMPHVSGYEVIGGAVAAGVPVVAVSGGDRLSGEDPLVEALNRGALLALRKPFSGAQVLGAVAECIAGTPPRPRVIEYVRG